MAIPGPVIIADTNGHPRIVPFYNYDRLAGLHIVRRHSGKQRLHLWITCGMGKPINMGFQANGVGLMQQFDTEGCYIGNAYRPHTIKRKITEVRSEERRVGKEGSYH